MKLMLLIGIVIIVQSGMACDSSSVCADCVRMPGCVFVHLLEDGTYTCIPKQHLHHFQLPYLYFVEMDHQCQVGAVAIESEENDDQKSSSGVVEEATVATTLASYWDGLLYVLGSVATIGMTLKYRSQFLDLGRRIMDCVKPRVPSSTENAATQNVINDLMELRHDKCSV